eukprot:Phypoly_transcript_07471.p1 GENE.Phypoly_transcript_07471~~Phypoly_transcript_07471.p1  ORF type:complete len:511 (+),score=85.24 Phypoly_transcript_07471:176-1534(+)
MEVSTDTQRTQEGFPQEQQPQQPLYAIPAAFVPSSVPSVPSNEQDTVPVLPQVASPNSTTLIQKNTPTQELHAKPPLDTNSDTDSVHASTLVYALYSLRNSPSPLGAESSHEERDSPIPSKSPTDGQPSIKVINEPLQPEVELSEQAQDRSPLSPTDTLKNLNSKRLPDSIPTELDSKKLKRNDLLMNEVNEGHAERILSKLLKDPWAPPFEAPVDPVVMNLPDYFDIIKRPMDLGTISTNLNDKKYPTVATFADDVRLVFNNAMLYNAVRSDIHKAARNFLQQFEDLMRNTHWDQAYDTKIPEVTTPIIAISKGASGAKPTPIVKQTEVTHIEEPRALLGLTGSPSSPTQPSKSDRRNGSHSRSGKHSGYNCLVYYQNETIPYDFEWQHLHSREEFEQKLRSALNITSMAELEIGIKKSKPNFAREVFVQLSPRWEEFPRVSCVLVKHKKQ